MIVSIVIRTYNEALYLDELLVGIKSQEIDDHDIEIIIVDSGSHDGTLEIASRHRVRIAHINKSDFTFGRSLNIGCKAAKGEILVFISGHCVPVAKNWLRDLIQPLIDNVASYTYGKQIGRDTSKYSEKQLFLKYFPEYSKIVQEGFFCNNANSAITREAWSIFEYNESLTGLEDMYLARQLYESGKKIAYIATAGVYHIHDETWRQVRVRYEREALALQQILPNVHFSFVDFICYTFLAIGTDFIIAVKERVFLREMRSVLIFRLMQYWGTYRGARRHRIISDSVKNSYFYPKDLERDKYVNEEGGCSATHEGQQRAS